MPLSAASAKLLLQRSHEIREQQRKLVSDRLASNPLGESNGEREEDAIDGIAAESSAYTARAQKREQSVATHSQMTHEMQEPSRMPLESAPQHTLPHQYQVRPLVPLPSNAAAPLAQPHLYQAGHVPLGMHYVSADDLYRYQQYERMQLQVQYQLQQQQQQIMMLQQRNNFGYGTQTPSNYQASMRPSAPVRYEHVPPNMAWTSTENARQVADYATPAEEHNLTGRNVPMSEQDHQHAHPRRALNYGDAPHQQTVHAMRSSEPVQSASGQEQFTSKAYRPTQKPVWMQQAISTHHHHALPHQGIDNAATPSFLRGYPNAQYVHQRAETEPVPTQLQPGIPLPSMQYPAPKGYRAQGPPEPTPAMHDFVGRFEAHFGHSAIALMTFKGLCNDFTARLIDDKMFYIGVYQILLQTNSMELLDGFHQFLPDDWKREDMVRWRKAVDQEVRARLIGVEGPAKPYAAIKQKAAQDIDMQHNEVEGAENEDEVEPGNDEEEIAKRKKKKSAYAKKLVSRNKKPLVQLQSNDAVAALPKKRKYVRKTTRESLDTSLMSEDLRDSTMGAMDEPVEEALTASPVHRRRILQKKDPINGFRTAAARAKVVILPIGQNKVHSKVLSNTKQQGPTSPLARTGKLLLATPRKAKSSSLADRLSTPNSKKVKHSVAHLGAADVPHVGQVFQTRRAVLSRAGKPYIHGMCGQGFMHPQDVKHHHTGCCKVRNVPVTTAEWNEHRSCTAGYPDINYTKVKDGFIILDQISWDKLDFAIGKTMAAQGGGIDPSDDEGSDYDDDDTAGGASYEQADSPTPAGPYHTALFSEVVADDAPENASGSGGVAGADANPLDQTSINGATDNPLNAGLPAPIAPTMPKASTTGKKVKGGPKRRSSKVGSTEGDGVAKVGTKRKVVTAGEDEIVPPKKRVQVTATEDENFGEAEVRAAALGLRDRKSL